MSPSTNSSCTGIQQVPLATSDINALVTTRIVRRNFGPVPLRPETVTGLSLVLPALPGSDRITIEQLRLRDSDRVLEELSVLCCDSPKRTTETPGSHLARLVHATRELLDVIYAEVRASRRLSSKETKLFRAQIDTWLSRLLVKALKEGAIPEELLCSKVRPLFERAKSDSEFLKTERQIPLSVGEALVLCRALRGVGVTIRPWEILLVNHKWTGTYEDGVPFAREAVRERMRSIAQSVSISDETTKDGFARLLPLLGKNGDGPQDSLGLLAMMKCIVTAYGSICLAIEDVVHNHPDFAAIRQIGFDAFDCHFLGQNFLVGKDGKPTERAIRMMERAFEKIMRLAGHTKMPRRLAELQEIQRFFTRDRLRHLKISPWGTTAACALTVAFKGSPFLALKAVVAARPARFNPLRADEIVPLIQKVPPGTWGSLSRATSDMVTLCQFIARSMNISLTTPHDLLLLRQRLTPYHLNRSIDPTIQRGRAALRRGFKGNIDEALRAVTQRIFPSFVPPP